MTDEAKRDDGGPAFPTMMKIGDIATAEGGLTVRDWFAAKAMTAIFGGQGADIVAARDSRYDETNWAEVVALNAYEMADAMLAERRK